MDIKGLLESKQLMRKIRTGIYHGKPKCCQTNSVSKKGRPARGATEVIAVIATGLDDPGGRCKGCYAARVAQSPPGSTKTKGSCARITATHILRAYDFVSPLLTEPWIIDIASDSKLGKPIADEMTKPSKQIIGKITPEPPPTLPFDGEPATEPEKKKPFPVLPPPTGPAKEIAVEINGCKVKGTVEDVRSLLPWGKTGV